MPLVNLFYRMKYRGHAGGPEWVFFMGDVLAAPGHLQSGTREFPG